MASYTVEELYYGEKYNIMGNAAAEIMTAGIPGDSEELRTQTELCLVKHTLLAARQMAREGDTVTGLS